MNTTYNNLMLTIHDQRKPAVGCGYYYTVTNGSSSHTAFRTKRALKQWLKNTGLKIGKRGCWGRNVFLVGEYSHESHMLDNNEFIAKFAGLETFYCLDNGNYVMGFIDRKTNTLHHQNPNTDRFIFDYHKVMTHLETGTPTRFIYK